MISNRPTAPVLHRTLPAFCDRRGGLQTHRIPKEIVDDVLDAIVGFE